MSIEGMRDTDRLASWIITAWEEHFFNRLGPLDINGDKYELADDVQYESLGEDPAASDLPLILVRERDGQFFEIDLDAFVRTTSPAEKQAERERHQRMREEALHLRMYGERAPGGNETWREWDRKAEEFLRSRLGEPGSDIAATQGSETSP